MSLGKWLIISGGLMGLGALLSCIALTGVKAMELPGLGVLTAGLLAYYSMARCPNCGRSLGRSPGRYCKGCGERIDFSQKPRF